MSLLFAACDDTSVDDMTDMNISDMQTEMKSDKWLVSYFFDDEDETYHYDGYEFDFQDGGILSVSNGATTITGSWSMRESSSGKDLLISFTAPETFEELSDDWDIKEFSDNQIKLEDMSGGDGSIDILHFDRL